METILITGGTGLIGRHLSVMLANMGYRVIILSRNHQVQPIHPQISFGYWNPNLHEIDAVAVRKADHIIHLAGAGVMDKRWNDSYKKQILQSRVNSGKLLIEVLSSDKGNVKTIVSSSAIGWYGRDEKTAYGFTETDAVTADFLGQTCQSWENSISTAKDLGIRLCIVRTGIVLSNKGGALKEFIKPLQFGIAGILGSGRQIISWIHIDDLCGMFIHLIQNKELSGIYNGVAPLPVSNQEMVKTVARIRNGKLFLPLHIPAFMLKLLIGEGSVEILKSTRVSADKILSTGFRFLYPEIGIAIENLIQRKRS
jgi:uncharacterized protein (TIGR01777 family)